MSAVIPCHAKIYVPSPALVTVLWTSTRSATAAVELRQAGSLALAAEGQAIAGLRERPQQAAETGLRHSDLLERVGRAMQTAELDSDTLVSTLPQPPRRLPGSDHAEVVHRLAFEALRLESLTRFCHALMQDNAELRITGLQLRSGGEPGTWAADVDVSYWIVAPSRGR